jgi:hypothetical protein
VIEPAELRKRFRGVCGLITDMRVSDSEVKEAIAEFGALEAADEEQKQRCLRAIALTMEARSSDHHPGMAEDEDEEEDEEEDAGTEADAEDEEAVPATSMLSYEMALAAGLIPVRKTITGSEGRTYEQTIWERAPGAKGKKGAKKPAPLPPVPPAAKAAPAPAPTAPPASKAPAPATKVEELATRTPPKWETSSTGQEFFAKNQTALQVLATGVREFTGQQSGVPSQQLTFKIDDSGNRGGFTDGAIIELSPERARGLSEAVQSGRVDTKEQLAGVKTALHEVFHASSAPHFYRREDGSIPLEEGTTELLAQHHLRSFAEKHMGLAVSSNLPTGPLFEVKEDTVQPTRKTSYAMEVKGFGQMVAWVDELPASISPEALSNIIAARALEVKRTVDTGPRPIQSRYAIFARKVLESRRVDSAHPNIETIRRNVQDTLSSAAAGSYLDRADWDGAIKGAIEQGEAGRR